MAMAMAIAVVIRSGGGSGRRVSKGRIICCVNGGGKCGLTVPEWRGLCDLFHGKSPLLRRSAGDMR